MYYSVSHPAFTNKGKTATRLHLDFVSNIVVLNSGPLGP